MTDKIKKAIFIIDMEWNEDHRHTMTAQIARDKLLTPLQELWILHIIDKFSIEEVTQPETINKLVRGNEQGERKSFYNKDDSKKSKKSK